jgi:hypothetical protein
MNTTQVRNYNCKDEELPVIGGYVIIAYKRDATDFFNYSPKFNGSYLSGFQSKVSAAEELLNPKTEIAESKVITARLYATASGLLPSLDRLEGYVKLAKNEIHISVADFGISLLRKKINRKDMEGVLKNLRLVISNTQNYRQILEAQGLTGDLVASLEAAVVSIAADNNLQYEMLTKRVELVRNNLNLLNDLYDQLKEICDVGKILYKKTLPEKANEYTFTHLLKKVRYSSKSKTSQNENTEDTLNPAK